MDAKEKLRLMNVIAGKLKGEVVVIDPESFRKEANIKNKEFYEVEKDAKPKYEIDVTDLTDAEILSSDIIIHIAEKTAERFEDMADTMEITTLKQLVIRKGRRSNTASIFIDRGLTTLSTGSFQPEAPF